MPENGKTPEIEMKNKETLRRRKEARANIPKGWKAVPRNKGRLVPIRSATWDPVNKRFVAVSEKFDAGRPVEDFYCVIERK